MDSLLPTGVLCSWIEFLCAVRWMFLVHMEELLPLEKCLLTGKKLLLSNFLNLIPLWIAFRISANFIVRAINRSSNGGLHTILSFPSLLQPDTLTLCTTLLILHQVTLIQPNRSDLLMVKTNLLKWLLNQLLKRYWLLTLLLHRLGTWLELNMLNLLLFLNYTLKFWCAHLKLFLLSLQFLFQLLNNNLVIRGQFSL